MNCDQKCVRWPTRAILIFHFEVRKHLKIFPNDEGARTQWQLVNETEFINTADFMCSELISFTLISMGALRVCFAY
jgi:hypothetical protein